MRRIVLSGQENFSEEQTFNYSKVVQAEARTQWIDPPALCRLTVFVMFYLDDDAEQKTLVNLLKPILRSLRRIIYMNENQIFQLSTGKVTRLSTEKRKVEIFIEEYEDQAETIRP